MASDIKKHRHDSLCSDFQLYLNSLLQHLNPNLSVNAIDICIESEKNTTHKCTIFSSNNQNFVTHKDAAYIIHTFVKKKGLHTTLDIETWLITFLEKKNTPETKNKDLSIFNIKFLNEFVSVFFCRLIDTSKVDFYKTTASNEDDSMFEKIAVTDEKERFPSVQPFNTDWSNEMVENIIGNMFTQEDYQKVQTTPIELDYPEKINHASTRPFVCHYKMCNRAFKRFEHLKRHYRIHTGERPFKCKFPGCHKAFARSDNLNQHLRVHSNETHVGHANIRNLRYRDEKD